MNIHIKHTHEHAFLIAVRYSVKYNLFGFASKLNYTLGALEKNGVQYARCAFWELGLEKINSGFASQYPPRNLQDPPRNPQDPQRNLQDPPRNLQDPPTKRSKVADPTSHPPTLKQEELHPTGMGLGLRDSRKDNPKHEHEQSHHGLMCFHFMLSYFL